jgi:hypothetical protein
LQREAILFVETHDKPAGVRRTHERAGRYETVGVGVVVFEEIARDDKIAVTCLGYAVHVALTIFLNRRRASPTRLRMRMPNPELIDDENPEWTDEMFANAVPFSALPAELQAPLSEERVAPDAESSSTHQSAA